MARRFLLAAAAVIAAGFLWFASNLVAPDPTQLVRDRRGQFLGEIGTGPHGEAGYWPLAELPERVVSATLAIEDRRFWGHPGIDPLAMARAAWSNLTNGRRTSGASTVAMQVARMQSPGPRTYLRKLRESAEAMVLTARFGRRAVLAHYLRLVPYGNRVHGIGYAARRYLDKPVDDLSWAEIAFLAAIPQSPARMNPYNTAGHARAVRRGERILAGLHAYGTIGTDDYELARRQIRAIAIPKLQRRPPAALHALMHLDGLLPERNGSQGSNVIDTTLDLELQVQLTATAADLVGRLSGQGAGNAALIVIERESNEVLAWVGSTDYFARRSNGAIDYTGVWRSPGSALKPFLYAYALDRGAITPATILDDLRRSRTDIVNADHNYFGPLLPRIALGNSRNIPAAELINLTGVDDTYSFLRDLGLHDGRFAARKYGLGLAIGGMPTTLARLVRAYTALAGDGRLGEFVWYAGQPRGEERRVLSEHAARAVSLFLADPMARLPTFPRMGATELPFAAAMKTGTSSDYRDAWTVGYSTRYVVGAWIGHPSGKAMTSLNASASSAVLVNRTLRVLHGADEDGLRHLAFPVPARAHPVRLCALSGKLAAPACTHVLTEWLRAGEEPTSSCDAHLHVAIDRRCGTAANADTPAEDIEVRSVVVLPARYAAWASANGLHSALRRKHQVDPRLAGQEVRLKLTSLADGMRILPDPEGASNGSTIALEALVEPPVEQVVWYVDGEPFAVADFPYSVRWPLRVGQHRFEVRLPFGSSKSDSVTVNVESGLL